MHQEEAGSGFAVVVVGGILLVLLVLGGGFFLFVGRSSAHLAAVTTGSPPVTVPGWGEVELRYDAGGTRVQAAILRQPADGSARELRAEWSPDGKLDTSASGSFEHGTRIADLTEQELQLLTKALPALAPVSGSPP